MIKYISYYTLINEESDILKHGLSFALPHSRINKRYKFTTFEIRHLFLTQNLYDEKDSYELKAEIPYISNSYVHHYRPSKNVLKKHGIIERLRNNNDILIMKPEKGNGIVIMNKTDYESCMKDIMNDVTKFKALDGDPTIKREGKQHFKRNLKKKGFLKEDV